MDVQLLILKSPIFIITLVVVFYMLKYKKTKTSKKPQEKTTTEIDLSKFSEEEKEKLWRDAVERLARNRINYAFPCIDKKQKPPV